MIWNKKSKNGATAGLRILDLNLNYARAANPGLW